MTPVRYRTIDVDGLDVFYREAGNPEAPKLLLLHGFPTSSHMFRDLIPRLAWIPTEPYQANDLWSLIAVFPGPMPSRP